ncbi:HET-domain-containing protein [Corynespora cassiicola Philippines]|uniref:HET-domain-containing protein n=1 Tax=Corynespora cassiicola Philippines TaxID=1448308 RepID=A0A2T2NU27_CORCC|nr:HET-domain-containing protein [Corynespora cassiicola Philippines]
MATTICRHTYSASYEGGALTATACADIKAPASFVLYLVRDTATYPQWCTSFQEIGIHAQPPHVDWTSPMLAVGTVFTCRQKCRPTHPQHRFRVTDISRPGDSGSDESKVDGGSSKARPSTSLHACRIVWEACGSTSFDYTRILHQVSHATGGCRVSISLESTDKYQSPKLGAFAQMLIRRWLRCWCQDLKRVAEKAMKGDRRFWVLCFGRPLSERALYLRFEGLSRETKESMYVQAQSNILEDTRSEKAMDIVRDWLGRCEDMHPACNVGILGFRPRRLIHVGDSDREPFLDDTDFAVGPYCALSYCWGGSNGNLKTTRENLPKHRVQIALEDMPKTVADAIFVCRSLKIQHLWVDALCILQDDVGNQDWLEHADQMTYIYGNSVLTISADASADCATSFLGKQRFASQSYHRLRPRDRAPIASDDPFLAEHQSGTHAISTSCMSTRGWTLQEKISSRRIIHFTGDEMVWQCRNSKWCECKYQEAYPASIINGVTLSGLFQDAMVDHRSRELLFHGWWRIAEQYSGRDLTFPQDKLVAISGLARQLQYAFGGAIYLSGLWETNLTQDLLWHVKPGTVASRYSEYIAPSWSWASMNGQVEYFKMQHYCTWRPEIEVLSASCSTMPSSPLGPVSDGYILLKGNLMPTILEVKECTHLSWTSPYSNIAMARNQRTKTQQSFVRCSASLAYEVLIDDVLGITPDISDLNHNSKSALGIHLKNCKCTEKYIREPAYYLLLIGSSYVQRDETRFSPTASKRPQQLCRIWWLVIQDSCVKGKFQRVGLGYITVHWDVSAAKFFGVQATDKAEIKLV